MRIFQLSYYQQAKDRHPGGDTIPIGYERIEIVTAGRCWVKHNGAWIEMQPGALLWHQSGDETIGRSDFQNPYECVNIIFKVTTDSKHAINRINRWPDLQQIDTFYREILNFWLDKDFPKEVLADYIYNTLRFVVAKGALKLVEFEKPIQVRRALAYIEENYEQKLDIKDLAKIADCSPPYLHELFQKHCSQSPYALLISIRIREACRRLSTTTDPIKQIAIETGFTHASAFSHSFKKTIGQSPAEYRKKMLYPFA